jgi:hypothetical protein
MRNKEFQILLLLLVVIYMFYELFFKETADYSNNEAIGLHQLFLTFSTWRHTIKYDKSDVIIPLEN